MCWPKHGVLEQRTERIQDVPYQHKGMIIAPALEIVGPSARSNQQNERYRQPGYSSDGDPNRATQQQERCANSSNRSHRYGGIPHYVAVLTDKVRQYPDDIQHLLRKWNQ